MRQTRLSESASFSVGNGADDVHKKIKFIFDDPDQQYKTLMVTLFPLSNPPTKRIECPMTYDIQTKKWSAEVERPNDAREEFIITPNITPEDTDAVKRSTKPLIDDFIAFENGVQKTVFNKQHEIPAGELKQFLYTADGKILDAISEDQLKEGERLITIYFPPGYDKDRNPPYNFQVTLDGSQYLNGMRMNVIFDNLIHEQKMEPVVNVFISPYAGAPDPTAEGLPPVTPPGHFIRERFKEYSCNPEFAEKLSQLPEVMREQFNITDDPKHTTLWGLSMGGLQAEYTALTYPECFGNVVAQSPMAWNIPTQRGENWREEITDNWETSSASLLPDEKHDEYITQAILSGHDEISGREIAQSQNHKLKFYFDAGDYEKTYDPAKGFANVVESTQLFSEALKQKGHEVVDYVVRPGTHDPITWMADIPAAAKAMHQPAARLAFEAEVKKVENNLLPPKQILGSEIPGQNIFDRMQALNVPNVSITVIKEKGIAWTREYDLATRSTHESEASQPEVFQAASTSKTVNAVLAMKLLVETGKIKIDDNLTDHLKKMGIENNTGVPITLGQLLSHTAGIPSGMLPDYHPSDTIPTTADVLRNSPLARIADKPGEVFHYSNCGTTIIQKLIEDACPGETYAALAQKHILGPLHMDHSTFERQSPAETKLNIQVGHVKTGDVVEGDWRLFPQLAAAGLWTTSNDLAIFATAIEDAYLGKDNTWMSQETANNMLTLQPTMQRNSAYGLGFRMEGEGDSVSFGHSGGSKGYSCDYVVFPHKGVGAVIMTNGDNGEKLIDEIERGLAQIYAWPRRGDCEYKQSVVLEEQNAKQCSGRFVVNFNGNDIVFFPRVENGKLHLSIPYAAVDSQEKKDLLLTPISQTEFICVEPISFNVQFNSDYSEMVVGGGLSTKRSNSPQTSEQALFGKTHVQTLATPRPVPTKQNEDDKKHEL